MVALIFRWRFQFSIRSLLVLVVAVAVPCSWLAVEMKAAREQATTVEEIVVLGGIVEDHDLEADANGRFVPPRQPSEPPWLRKVLGNHFFTDVVVIKLSKIQSTEVPLAYIVGLPRREATGEIATDKARLGAGEGAKPGETFRDRRAGVYLHETLRTCTRIPFAQKGRAVFGADQGTRARVSVAGSPVSWLLQRDARWAIAGIQDTVWRHDCQKRAHGRILWRAAKACQPIGERRSSNNARSIAKMPSMR